MISDLNDPGLTGFLPGTDGAAILAEKNCEIAGAAMGADRAGTGYLWGMYVRRDHQRLGLGSAILAELVRQLPDAGRFEVRVLVESPWALNFYRKHGFSELGRELLQFTEGYCRNVTLMAVSRRRIESSLQAIV